MQVTWISLACRNCFIGLADLLFRRFKSVITNPVNIDINTIFVNHTLKK